MFYALTTPDEKEVMVNFSNVTKIVPYKQEDIDKICRDILQCFDYKEDEEEKEDLKKNRNTIIYFINDKFLVVKESFDEIRRLCR